MHTGREQMENIGVTLEDNPWTLQGLHYKIIYGQVQRLHWYEPHAQYRGYIGREWIDITGLHLKRIFDDEEYMDYNGKQPIDSSNGLRLKAKNTPPHQNRKHVQYGGKIEGKACAVQGLSLKGKNVQYRGYTWKKRVCSTGANFEGKACTLEELFRHMWG